jgi:hypothetical protein
LETAAQAALIVCQGRLWAYAGELPQPAAQELAEAVADCWDRNGESDLARFVHLDSDNGEYMLYATALGGGMVLALVFGVETPFSKIRSQAGHLARLLATPPIKETGVTRPKEENGQAEGDEDEPLLGDVPPPTQDPWLDGPLPSTPQPIREEDWISEYPDLTAGSPLYASAGDKFHGASPIIQTAPGVDLCSPSCRHSSSPFQASRYTGPKGVHDGYLGIKAGFDRRIQLDLRALIAPALARSSFGWRLDRTTCLVGVAALYRLCLAAGASIHPPRLPAMECQCAARCCTRTHGAGNPPAYISPDFCRISRPGSRKPIWGFLGGGLFIGFRIKTTTR